MARTPEDLPPVTEEMKNKVAELKNSFVSQVRACARATADEVRMYGWATKGKEAWLNSIVDRYDKDLHKILGD